MNRGTIITLIVIALAAGGGVYGYRNHKQNTERELQERRAAFDKAEAARHAEEARKNEESLAEARRLALAKAAAESEASAKELEHLRTEQIEAEARRLAAQEEAQNAIKAREKLALEKQKSDAARLAALQEISRLEHEKKAAADREAARLAALQRQQELEVAEAKKIPAIPRLIYPSDYKRRQHYYLDVEMQNAENAKPPTRPKPASQTTTP